jgi:outer membrane protein assembly factor BamA
MTRAVLAQSPPPAASPEVVGEVRIHGNYRTPDAQVLSLAGVAIGRPLEANGLEAVATRLRRSGRFEAVEVRKLGRSLDDPSDVALIIIVREVPGADALGNLPGPFARLGRSLMALPVLDYVDGYGLTLGGRLSFVNVLGRDGMVSVPLTWGGTKRAAIEIDKRVLGAPISRVQVSAFVSSRDNPHFDVGDRRSGVALEVSRSFRTIVTAGARAGWASVTFGAARDRVATYGVHLAADTRSNPAFPRNAILAEADWTRLDSRRQAPVNRFQSGFRGYVGLPWTAVLAVGGTFESADGPEPDFEKALLGGADNLRGFRAGSFAGDNLLAASIELRVPTTSPMRFGQSGIVVFGDAGSAWNHGEHRRDAPVERGYGAGWYLVAPFVRVNIDLGYGVGKGARLHVVTGLKF